MKGFILRVAIAIVGAALVAFALVILRAADSRYALSRIAATGRFDRFDGEIADAGSISGVDPDLIKAVAWSASRFDPGLVRGEKRGLLLVSEPIAREWAASAGIDSLMFSDLLDAQTNLRAGAWAIARARERWKTRDNPMRFALAEFHAGRGVIERRAGEYATAAGMLRAMDPDTREFVDAVMGRAEAYRSAR